MSGIVCKLWINETLEHTGKGNRGDVRRRLVEVVPRQANTSRRPHSANGHNRRVTFASKLLRLVSSVRHISSARVLISKDRISKGWLDNNAARAKREARKGSRAIRMLPEVRYVGPFRAREVRSVDQRASLARAPVLGQAVSRVQTAHR